MNQRNKHTLNSQRNNKMKQKIDVLVSNKHTLYFMADLFWSIAGYSVHFDLQSTPTNQNLIKQLLFIFEKVLLTNSWFYNMKHIYLMSIIRNKQGHEPMIWLYNVMSWQCAFLNLDKYWYWRLWSTFFWCVIIVVAFRDIRGVFRTISIMYDGALPWK